MRFRDLFVASCTAVLVVFPSVVRAAGELRYAFKDAKDVVYNVTITGEVGDAVETYRGQIRYTIESVDPANGQATFGYSSNLKSDKPQKGGPGWMRPPTAQEIWGQPAREPARITINPQGGVVRTNRTEEGDQLPYMQGLAWALLVQPLADGGAWKIDQPISLYEKKEVRPASNWGPPHMRQAVYERVTRPARETISFNVEKTDGDVVTVRRKYLLESGDKVGDAPNTRQAGDGTFAFDTAKGLIRSMDMAYTIEVNEKNVTIKVPVTVKAELLSADELAALHQAEEEARERAEEQAAANRKRMAEERKYDVTELPAGAKKTAFVGEKDGSAFIKMSPTAGTLVGFQIETGEWFGASIFKKFEPVFDRPAADDPDAESEMIAKPGYVVSGMIASGTEFANAVKIVFARETNGRVDPKDTYTTEWIGQTKGGSEVTLGGTGQHVIGVFGAKGLNIHRIGLVVATPEAAAKIKAKAGSVKPIPSAAADEDEAAQLKRIEAAWQKRPGKTTDLLATMSTGRQPDADGNIVLKRGEQLATTDNIKAPVSFRAVVWTQVNDLRLAHAADQLIFNWEMRPGELRVDGGPATGKHKPGAGQLPADQWVGIEWIINPGEMIVYVNGQEQYRAKARFADVNKTFSIKSHQGTTKVKSIAMVK